MGTCDIEGVIVTPLKRINQPKGDVLHVLKSSDPGYVGFGEAYFSTVNHGEVKGWNRHKRMTLNLAVPHGKVVFAVFDNRELCATRGRYCQIELSESAYQRLTIPPGLWVGFKGKGATCNYVLNIADMPHDANEVEKLDLCKIDFPWENV